MTAGWVLVAIFGSDIKTVVCKQDKEELIEDEECEYKELGGCMHSKILPAASDAI